MTVCVCLGSSGESELCSLNINTDSLSSPRFPLLLPPDTHLYVSFCSNASHLLSFHLDLRHLFSLGVYLFPLSTVWKVSSKHFWSIIQLLFTVYALTRWAVAEGGRGGGHCCLQVESLRILLAVETPLREGLDEEEDRRSALALLFRDPPSVPFTQTGLARAGLWSACPWSRSSSATCP